MSDEGETTMRLPMRPPTATRLLLIRHGEPEEDARGRCYGRLDVGLSPTGRFQAGAAAAALASEPVDAVYASPRRRAVESARFLADAHHLEVVVEDDFREIDFGRFEGRSYDEIAVEDPETYRAWMERPTEVTFPGGESYAEMRERVARAARRVREAHAGRTVAIVAHGGTNRVLLAEALGVEAAGVFRFDQSFAAVNVVDYYPDFTLVRLLNGTF